MKLLEIQRKTALIIGAICSLSLFSTLSIAAVNKHVAVPPEDLTAQQLPSPQSRGIFSHSTMLPIFAAQEKSTNNAVTQKIHFDGEGDSPIIFVSPNAQNYRISITDPNGAVVVDESSKRALPTSSSIRIGQQDFQGRQFVLQAPSSGEWTIRLSANNNNKTSTTTDVNTPLGYILFKGDTDFELFAHLDDNMTLQNRRINLTTYMVDTAKSSGNRQLSLNQSPLAGTIESAVATITLPSKKQVQVRLADNGRNGDKVAGDGVYTGPIPTSETGIYTSQLQVTGTRPDGAQFSRTVTEVYPIEARSIQFADATAQLERINGQQLQISVPVKTKDAKTPVYLATEIWGTDRNGNHQAAAWAGGLASPALKNGRPHLALNFDSRWIERQGLRAPFRLKNLRIHNASNHVPLAMTSQQRMTMADELRASFAKAAQLSRTALSTAITPDMLMGNAPTGLSNIRAAGSKLLLVHGYCSGNVWNTSNFSNSVEFKDYDKNRSHDEFARLILDFGSAYDSFGIVAHSQGGAAALHLYSRYWSGLDNATGGRLIQSLGTPYQGTSLAGNLALLGQIFGIGCGTNTDLTYNGAANWLSTIPNWARAQVDYYTTSFATKWWRWDYCNIGSDLLLRDPEDGTTEKWSGQLSGAVNKGHKKGWCHTRSMRDPAQYTDGSRNSSMNSRAAR